MGNFNIYSIYERNSYDSYYIWTIDRLDVPYDKNIIFININSRIGADRPDLDQGICIDHS